MDTLTTALIDTTGKTLWQLICERADATPNKRMAIDEKGRTLTFGEYRAWSERVAAGLAAHGIGTARGFQVSKEIGTFAGLGMGLNGMLTAILAPSLVPVLVSYFFK